MEVITSFLRDQRGFWKHIFLKKRANFPLRKSFWPIFYRIFQFDKTQGTVSINPEASLTNIDEKLRSFLQDLRGCWKKTTFWKKKAIFPVKKRFCPIFSLFIEYNKGQDTIFDDPQGLFDNYFSIDKVFSLGPKRSIARNFTKFSCSHGDKSSWLTFHRIINCDKPPRTVYKKTTTFFWQILWKN